MQSCFTKNPGSHLWVGNHQEKALLVATRLRNAALSGALESPLFSLVKALPHQDFIQLRGLRRNTMHRL